MLTPRHASDLGIPGFRARAVDVGPAATVTVSVRPTRRLRVAMAGMRAALRCVVWCLSAASALFPPGLRPRVTVSIDAMDGP